MSYYNRLTQFDFTLQTLAKSQCQDFEIICVDDYSDSDHDPRILQDRYPQLNLKIIRMWDLSPHRWYINPCVPYNVAFRHSQGQTIIIQNPECCHIGDVISHCAAHINDQTYLSYHCWSATKDQLEYLRNYQPISYEPRPKGMWYNHAVHRAESFHFCTALTRKNLITLNGFDERFANGLDYDDNEFVWRVRNLGLNITYIADPHVVHQPHPKFLIHANATTDNKQLFWDLRQQNLVTAPNKEKIS
jgi:hypothetical protein